MGFPRAQVEPLTKGDLASLQAGLFIGALGYESRASHAFGALRTSFDGAVVIGFPYRQVLSYSSNREAFLNGGAEAVEAQDQDVYDIVRVRLEEGAVESVIIDISSFSRTRLAAVLFAVADVSAAKGSGIVANFVYSPAVYQAPADPIAPIEICEPVTPDLAGHATDPELPTVVVLGIGYEGQRGLGVIEFLEASDAWVFAPLGIDPRFDADVEAANAQLLADLASHRLDYRLDNPIGLVKQLESLVYSLSAGARVVLVPMGPKMFAACCLILGVVQEGAVSVWRISSGSLEEPRDAVASGDLVGFRWHTGLPHESIGS